MIIKSLKLRNFMSHKDSSFEFEEGTNLIIGPNGSGKTGIIRAIGLIFGHTTIPQNKLIHFGENTAEIIMEVEENGKVYEIKKTFGSKSSNLITNITDDISLGHSKINVINEIKKLARISDHIDLPLLWRDCIRIESNSLTIPFKMEPSRRRMIFDSLLQLADYEKGWSLLRDPLSLLEKETVAISAKIAQWDPKIIQRLQDQIDLLDKTFNSNVEKYNELKREADDLESIVEQLQSKKDGTVDKTLEIREKINSTKSLLKETILKRAKLSQQISSLEEETICPTCGQEIDDNEKAIRKEELVLELNLMTEKIEFYDNSIGEMEQEYKNNTKEVSEGKQREVVKLKEETKRLVFLHEEKAALRRENELIQIRIKTLTDSLGRANSRAKSISNLKKRLEKVNKLHEQLSAFRTGVRAVGPLMASLITERVSYTSSETLKILTGNPTTEIIWHPDYSISLIKEGDPLDFTQRSTGEQALVALSIRLSLAEQMSDLGLMVLDEPTANLDGNSRTNLASTLSLNNLTQIFVISHDEAFGSYATTVIALEKDTKGITHVRTD